MFYWPSNFFFVCNKMHNHELTSFSIRCVLHLLMPLILIFQDNTEQVQFYLLDIMCNHLLVDLIYINVDMLIRLNANIFKCIMPRLCFVSLFVKHNLKPLHGEINATFPGGCHEETELAGGFRGGSGA